MNIFDWKVKECLFDSRFNGFFYIVDPSSNGIKYLWKDGVIHGGTGSSLEKGYWSTKREAERFLDNWLNRQKGNTMNKCEIETRLNEIKREREKLDTEEKKLNGELKKKEIANVYVGQVYNFKIEAYHFNGLVHYDGFHKTYTLISLPDGGWFSGTFFSTHTSMIDWLNEHDAEYKGYFNDLYKEKC